MGQVYHLHRSRSKQWDYAHTYVKIFETEGWVAAGKYFSDVVPESLHTQVTSLIKRELLRKGIDVTF